MGFAAHLRSALSSLYSRIFVKPEDPDDPPFDPQTIAVTAVVRAGSNEVVALAAAAARRNWNLETPDPGGLLPETLQRPGPHVIIVDSDLYGSGWRRFCAELKYDPAEVLLLLIGPSGDDCFYEEALCRGAYAVVAKPLDLAPLIRAVEGAWNCSKRADLCR